MKPNSNSTGPKPGDYSSDIPLITNAKSASTEKLVPPAVEIVKSADSAVSSEPPTIIPAVVTPAEAAAMQLTPPQRTAIIRLTSGATRAEAALAAGVTRTTLYRWLNHDPNFKAAFNAWHKDLVTTAQGQLLAASQDAIACVLTAIRRGDSRLAWKLLENLGLTNPGKPGSTDVGHLQRQAQLDEKRAEIAERKEINDVIMDDMTTLPAFRDPPL